jgi:hypothetical protein
MSVENPLWGAPRIHGELLKLGIEVAQSTVAKYMAKRRPGSGQTWKTFMRNHVAGIGAMDFLVVPTINFRLLFVLVNGIPLSKIHHAAFDAHLIGIDPDYRLHVSDRLLRQNDGPMLEALKRLNGGTICFPDRERDRPDRERLAQRFERFKAAH